MLRARFGAIVREAMVTSAVLSGAMLIVLHSAVIRVLVLPVAYWFRWYDTLVTRYYYSVLLLGIITRYYTGTTRLVHYSLTQIILWYDTT